MIRLWYIDSGKLNSCKINVNTVAEARRMFRKALPSKKVKIGICQKINAKEVK
jgi:hypothetical protein